MGMEDFERFVSHRSSAVIVGVDVWPARAQPHAAHNSVVLPLFALLLVQAKWRLLLAALIVVGLFTFWGVHLTGIGLGDYLSALKVYNVANAATDSSSVGFAKLVTLMSGIGSGQARLVAVGTGALVIVILLALHFRRPSSTRKLESDPALPAYLLLGVGFLGARGYDLVFVIPIFVWLISLADQTRWLVWPALLMAASFLIPQRAIELAYERILSEILPVTVYDILLGPFRSWAVLALLLLSILLFVRLSRDRWSNSQVL